MGTAGGAVSAGATTAAVWRKKRGGALRPNPGSPNCRLDPMVPEVSPHPQSPETVQLPITIVAGAVKAASVPVTTFVVSSSCVCTPDTGADSLITNVSFSSMQPTPVHPSAISINPLLNWSESKGFVVTTAAIPPIRHKISNLLRIRPIKDGPFY